MLSDSWSIIYYNIGNIKYYIKLLISTGRRSKCKKTFSFIEAVCVTPIADQIEKFDSVVYGWKAPSLSRSAFKRC